MSSTFKVEVVKLVPITKLETADSLGTTQIWGYQAVVRLDDFKEGDLAAYIPPDSIVPDTEQFAFLAGHRRIKVRKYRGAWSMGLPIHAPEGSKEGDDVAELLGITHYEPQLVSIEAEPPPAGFKPTYDVEHILRYNDLFERGELVVVTEKIHGANTRLTYQDGRLWAGSRNQWVAYNEHNPAIFWKAMHFRPEIEEFLLAHEGFTLYGESYGWVSNLRYGHEPRQVSIRFFDIWDEHNAKFLEHDDARKQTGFSTDLWVPELYRGPFEPSIIAELAEGNTTIPGANHKREGIVIKPLPERASMGLGGQRLQLKLVGNGYLEKSKDE